MTLHALSPQLALLVFTTCATLALARDDGRWAQSEPETRRWFEQQIVPDGPSKGFSCCAAADGVQSREDIREGHYWARFTISVNGVDIDVPWTRVEDERVLTGPFPARIGQPVVWWYADWEDSRSGIVKRREDGSPIVHIRCYKPGSGV